ncbi:MAG: arg [Firmicutes bacterium]|nr:arg [Bacillota bacterium]
MCKHLNLVFPQWQGGPKRQVYDGAMQLAEALENKLLMQRVPVDLNEELELEKNIIGYKSIVNQLRAAVETLTDYNPETIFTIGGNCSVSIAPIGYLNQRFNGDLVVVWLDAHGDINSPESSPSKLFTGMPIRQLLGEGDSEIDHMLPSKLKPDQIILAGTRDLDLPEAEYIKMAGIKIITPEVLELSPETVFHSISSKGYTHVYVHIDTDVLTETAFKFSAWPSKEGITMKTLTEVLDNMNDKFRFVGASLVEFLPCDALGMTQLQLICKKILTGLTPNAIS